MRNDSDRRPINVALARQPNLRAHSVILPTRNVIADYLVV